MNVYNEGQKNLLQLARYKHLPLSKFVSDKFTENEMIMVLDGLEKAYDVTDYANIKFNYLQMHMFIKFKDHNLEIPSWITNKLTHKDMELIYRFLLDGYDPKPYIEKGLHSKQLAGVLEIIKTGDENLLAKAEELNYNFCKMARLKKYPDDEIILNSDLYGLNSCFDENQMILIEDLAQDVPEIVNYIYPEMSNESIREIYLGLLNQIDVNVYALPCYSAQKMKFLRECLESNIDITYISKPDLQIEEMEMRLKWN